MIDLPSHFGFRLPDLIETNCLCHKWYIVRMAQIDSSEGTIKRLDSWAVIRNGQIVGSATDLSDAIKKVTKAQEDSDE